MEAYDLAGPVTAFSRVSGLVYGTCAGLIIVARDTVEGSLPTLDLMDIVARRNAFGRQVRSFEADLAVAGIGPAPLRAVFIRAPWVESAGPGSRCSPPARATSSPPARVGCSSRRSIRSLPTTRACTN